MKRMISSLFITLGTSFLMTYMPLYVHAAALEMNGNVAISGTVSAVSFTGSGVGITNIPGTAITNTSITVNQLADGAVTADKLADSAVTADKLADATVTPAKIGFLGKVAIVAVSGGDYTNPATAMSDYSSWCGAPSATNTCLLKIMPGTYDIGTSSVQMQSYIDIEGSGENTTIIKGSLASLTSGAVNGASNAEIRFLSIKNTVVGTYAIAVYNSGASLKMTNVTATASGATSNNFGIRNENSSSPTILNVTATASGGATSYGIINLGSSSATLTNVTATGSGGTSTNIGVYNHTSSATMMNVTATGTGGSTLNAGVYNYASSGSYTVKINHSIISGTSSSVNTDSQNFTTLVGSSELGGASVNGPVTCAGVYDANYTFHPSSCP